MRNKRTLKMIEEFSTKELCDFMDEMSSELSKTKIRMDREINELEKQIEELEKEGRKWRE